MAITFDNTSAQRVDFGAATAVRSLATKTVAAWINPTDFSLGFVCSLDGAATNESWFIEVISNAIEFSQRFSTQDGIWHSTLTTGLHHLAVTYDDSATGNNPKIYIDGVSVSVVKDQAPTGTASSGSTNTFVIGGSTRIPFASFKGNEQDLRVYNRILTAAEIAALAGSSRTIEMNDNGLVFHAPLMYAANRYSTLPFAGTLGATDYTYDRINGVQGTPTGSPVGAADMVYGSAF